MKLTWTATLPNGDQRKRSAQTWTSSPSRSTATWKRFLRNAPPSAARAAPVSSPAAILAVCGARSKKASVMTIRGLVAVLQRPGIRRTEHMTTLAVSSSAAPLNQIEENTEKSPSLSRTSVQPPYRGRTVLSHSA